MRYDLIFLNACLNSALSHIRSYIETCGDGEMDYLHDWHKTHKRVHNEIVLASQWYYLAKRN